VRAGPNPASGCKGLTRLRQRVASQQTIRASQPSCQPAASQGGGHLTRAQEADAWNLVVRHKSPCITVVGRFWKNTLYRFPTGREMLAHLWENGIFSPHGNVPNWPVATRTRRSPALVAAAQSLSLVCS